ncbi:MAG: hypothetical protein LBL91_06245 [Lachnospiraceae bacterium]|jgi:hypothetical protein|nr:hypothetical protein [Lachnospiraceae bacterium]
MKINVLGTDYKIIIDAEVEQYPQLTKVDGYCDTSIKLIVVAKFEKNERSVGDLKYHSKKVLRHELIHAFLYESGLWENSVFGFNEELTDWIAMQFPKIEKAFKGCDCL